MNLNKSHIIDPERLATTWGIPWKKIEENGEVLDENQFLFPLKGGQVFVLNQNEPNKIDFWANAHGQTTDLIEFNNITRVVYSKQRQAIAFESTDKDFYSEMLIKNSGKFTIAIAKPIRLYSVSLCEIISKDSRKD